MSICINPELIQTIDLDECIGLSLATLNTNYKLLKDENCVIYNNIDPLGVSLSSLNTRYKELTALRNGIAKAAVAFDGTGTATPSVFSQFNVTRVLRRSTGVFELSFTTAFPNISYALIGTSMLTATSANNFSWVQPSTTFATTSATINIRDLSGTYVNPRYVSIIAYSL